MLLITIIVSIFELVKNGYLSIIADTLILSFFSIISCLPGLPTLLCNQSIVMGAVLQPSLLLIVSSIISVLNFIFVHSCMYCPNHDSFSIERSLMRWSEYMALREDQYFVYNDNAPCKI